MRFAEKEIEQVPNYYNEIDPFCCDWLLEYIYTGILFARVGVRQCWDRIRGRSLPRCPRCNAELDAREHRCERRCETCNRYNRPEPGWCYVRWYYHSKKPYSTRSTGWCKMWNPKKETDDE